MNADHTHTPPPSHLFAWAGVSFQLPQAWQLSDYAFSRHTVTVKFEDAYTRRLQVEWTPLEAGSARTDITRIQQRYAKVARKLTESARNSKEIKSLPTPWTAFVYHFTDGARLVTAFAVVGDPSIFCFMQIYFNSKDTERPPAIAELITSTFNTHFHHLTPWSFYDVEFDLPADFRLVNTSLQAGSKLLVFQWRFRRFHIWHFSLADVLLKHRELDDWVAEFLNLYRGIKGRRFVSAAGAVEARRTWRYRLATQEEIARWCFRCRINWRHDPDKNQIRLCLFSYRKESDLLQLPEGLL